jgi:hypothetical protein
MTTKIKNPGAAVLIFNYKYRLGETGITEDQAHEVEQIVLNTVSLISVSTSKTKSQPAGSFEITLAPTKNWVNTITPGSWCAILMSQDKIGPKDTKYNNPKASKNKLKMIGRIESVRVVTSVRQEDGALTTQYIVTGSDWGDIFNTNLYVDPLIRKSTDEKDPIGTSERMIYNNYVTGFKVKDGKLPTSTDNIKTLLTFLGADASRTRMELEKKYQSVGRISESRNIYKIPKELSKYLGTTNNNQDISPVIADIVQVIAGKLFNKDGEQGAHTYETISDGCSVIPLDSILGINSFWQLIVNNSNHWINESFCELRWDKPFDEEELSLCLYNRVKPFALRGANKITEEAEDGKKPKNIEPFVSLFRDVRVHKIDPNDIITVNAGNNWRDRFNFIEVNVAYGGLGGVPENNNWTADTKTINQSSDVVAIGRDGFKPLIINTKFIPQSTEKDDTLDVLRIADYKEINKEWFFNIHRMLNGSLTLVGQSDYIPVGDNIIIPAGAIFKQNNANYDNLKFPDKSYFLAHVEAINHSCTVSATGARNFVTQIQFVRGIIVDEDGKEIKTSPLLDQDTTQVSPAQELNSDRAFGTSSGRKADNYPADPDIQKLRGK